jgi:hypothetical protein
MVDFTAKTYASNSVVLLDIKMGASGTYIVPAPTSNGSWTPHKRDGSGNYVLAANTGFGVASAGACAIPEDELSAYIWHVGTAYRGRRSGGGSDDFAYAPDNWNLATGTPRGGDVSPDGTHLAAGVGNVITIYDTTTKLSVYSLNLGDPIECVVYSPSGQYLIAGCRNNGLHLWHFDSGTYTKITTGTMAAPTGYGNWSVTWHADEDKFVAGQGNNGSSRGAWVWLLTNAGTHEFTAQSQAIYDVAPATNVDVYALAFLNHTDAKDYIMICEYGIYVPRVYKWNGSGFALQGNTGLGAARRYEVLGASRTGHSIVWTDSVGTPKTGVWEFAEIATGETANVEADLPGYEFDALMPNSIIVDGEADLPTYDGNGVIATAEGVLPGSPIRVLAAQIAVTPVEATTSSVAAEDFAYIYHQALPGYEFSASSFQPIIVEAEADLPAYGFDALVYQNVEVSVEADLPGYAFEAEGEVERLSCTVEADLPAYTSDGFVLTGVFASVAVDLPMYEFDAVARFVYEASVEGDLPGYSFEALGGSEGDVTVTADLPAYAFDAEGIVEALDITVAADLPGYEFEAFIHAPSGVVIDGDLPGYEFEGTAEAPLGIRIGADLPGYAFEAILGTHYIVDVRGDLPGYAVEASTDVGTAVWVEADLPTYDAEVIVRQRYFVDIDGDLPGYACKIEVVTFEHPQVGGHAGYTYSDADKVREHLRLQRNKGLGAPIKIPFNTVFRTSIKPVNRVPYPIKFKR